MDKRTFIKTGLLAGSGLIASTGASAAGFIPNNEKKINNQIDIFMNDSGLYALPELPFEKDALEPYIDKKTIEIHHGKHHAGYVKGLNKAMEKIKEATNSSDFGIIKHWERELAFHGGGHFLHTMYWNNMGVGNNKPGKKLSKLIDKEFGSFKKFKALFSAATKSVEGSGWGVLAYQQGTGKLVVLQNQNHQHWSQWLSVPILVCDVWEHAYYLNYQNRRGDYIDNFFKIINWDIVSKRLDNLL